MTGWRRWCHTVRDELSSSIILSIAAVSLCFDALFISFHLYSFLSHFIYFMLYIFCCCFFSFLFCWSVAHTTLAARWSAVPDTLCPLTPPRCTPFPRLVAQGQTQTQNQRQNQSQNQNQGPAQRPVDRHAHSLLVNSQWARRRLMVMMRDLPAFQSVGECVGAWFIDGWTKGHSKARGKKIQ